MNRDLDRIEAKLDWLHAYLTTQGRTPWPALGPWPGTECEPAPDSPPARTIRGAITIDNEHLPEPVTIVPSHEYEITTMVTGVERKPRYHRMGFMGASDNGPRPRLQFSARGPDRTHAGRYGGTQEIDQGWILSIIEVTRNDAARYVAQLRPLEHPDPRQRVKLRERDKRIS